MHCLSLRWPGAHRDRRLGAPGHAAVVECSCRQVLTCHTTACPRSRWTAANAYHIAVHTVALSYTLYHYAKCHIRQRSTHASRDHTACSRTVQQCAASALAEISLTPFRVRCHHRVGVTRHHCSLGLACRNMFFPIHFTACVRLETACKIRQPPFASGSCH